MDVILSKESPDLQECDLLVTGFFQDERPLKGCVGWLDWRFNGLLSHFILEKRLTGDWKETILIPSQGRVTPALVLLLGLGGLKEYSYLRLREIFPYLLETIQKLKVKRICLSFPYGETTNVDCGKLTEVLLEGMVDSLDTPGHSIDETWLRGVQVFFGEGEEYFYEILLGVQTAKMILEERFPIRIFTPSQEDSNGSMAQKASV
ncbi:MAG: M17 family peptidase N-terminal domain-containing protein [Thermodesulfobacteriota bacterium]